MAGPEQTLTVAIIFGSIGILAFFFILYLVIKQRLKKNRLKRAKTRLQENHLSKESFIKKKTLTSDTLNNPNHISLNMNQEVLDEEKIKSKNFSNEMAAMQLDDDIYKYLGISLSEIPFIDESTSNTCTNTYCQNSCIDLPAAVASSKFFRYQPLTR